MKTTLTYKGNGTEVQYEEAWPAFELEQLEPTVVLCDKEGTIISSDVPLSVLEKIEIVL